MFYVWLSCPHKERAGGNNLENSWGWQIRLDNWQNAVAICSPMSVERATAKNARNETAMISICVENVGGKCCRVSISLQISGWTSDFN